MTLSPAFLPMFPLGSTVFPQQVVPLHVFEPRYRALLEEITNDPESAGFGITLIDRGHEVGGGDHRTLVGTRVEVLQAERFDDGRWAVVVAGVERIDILKWLPDDPYPQAAVASRTVIDNGGSDLDALGGEVTRTINLMAEVAGRVAPEPHEFSSDPRTRLDQLSAVAPLSEFDRQRVLEAPTTNDQVTLLREALADKQLLLRAQLGLGGDFG